MPSGKTEFKPERSELVRLYVGQVLSGQEIAEQFGVSYHRVYNALVRHGIPRRPGGGDCARRKSPPAGFGGWNRGIPLPMWQRENLSRLARMRVGSKATRYGATLSEETKAKISRALVGRYRGCENPKWKPEKVARRRFESRREYKVWRGLVFARDGYICVMCGQPSKGDIQGHHIRTVEAHHELMLIPDNGVTLHERCHETIRHHEAEWEPFFDAYINYCRTKIGDSTCRNL